MKKINEKDVETELRASPKGNFELLRRHVSLALGGIRDIGEWGGGHPFDVEVAVIPPGKRNFPYHSHAAQWEYYIVLEGSGTFYDGDHAPHAIEPGDHVICAPGEAHQVHNTSDQNLRFIVIADHNRADVTTYPHTNKRLIKPEIRVIKFNDVDFYEGEE